MTHGILEKCFKLRENSTTIKTEVIAGLTTFMTMAYILAVNPFVLSKAGMNPSAVFTATALSAAIGTIVMAFYANLPIGVAPGMGANSFFAFTVVIAMGNSWEFALTAVLFEGIIFIILTMCKIREAVVNCFSSGLKHAISCGIGLFITFIGLINAGIVKTGQGVPLQLGNFKSVTVLLALVGLIITGVLLQKNIKGSLLISILIITVIGIPLGVTKFQNGFSLLSLPPSLSPIFCKFEWHKIFTVNMAITVIILLFMELFDTIGTLLGVATRARLVDSKGNVKNIKQALMADAVATTTGAILGTSTVTAYVESTAGVAEGGKTGLTALTIAIFFLLSLFISPVFLAIPSSATSPILIIVGLFMLTPIKELNFGDFSESIPFFLMMIMMPFSFSIADGIVIGTLAYVLLKILNNKMKELNVVIIVLATLFAAKLIFVG